MGAKDDELTATITKYCNIKLRKRKNLNQVQKNV